MNDERSPDATAHKVNAHVGSRIRQCRIDRGRSLQSLATHLKVSVERLERYESGEERITALQLKQLANALDVSLSHFFADLAAQLETVAPAAKTGWLSYAASLKGPLILAVAYYVGAEAAFYLGTLSDRIFAPFWPPNIVLFCALLLVPYKRWWLFIAAALPAHILAELQVAMSTAQIAVAFATNCMVAVLSALGVRHLLGEPPWFDNFQRAMVYVAVTAVVSPAIAALGGAFVRISGGAPIDSYGLFWAQWYLANALAGLTLGPTMLAWIERDAVWWASTSGWRRIEAFLTIVCLVLACLAVGQALPLTPGGGLVPALLYLPLPAIIWAAVRFGARGASGAVLIVTALTIWSALNGAGMFVGADPERNVLDLQLFLVALSVPVLLLGASVDGARRTEEVTRELARSLLAARDDEKRRAGNDLHESIAQALVAAIWLAEEAQRSPPGVGSSLKSLEELLQRTVRDVRAVSSILHPPLLDAAGLETALSQYVDDYAKRNGARITLDISPDLRRLSPHVELALFRVVEEALDNVRAQLPDHGSHIKIALVSRRDKRDVLLTVEGYPKEAPSTLKGAPALIDRFIPIARTQSMGIASIRERVARIGGRLQTNSSAGNSVVRAVIPLSGTNH